MKLKLTFEYGDCLENGQKPYFIVEVPKSLYEMIKNGELPYLCIPFRGIGNTGLVSIELKQDECGCFVHSIIINHHIVKVKKIRSKKCMAFLIYDAKIVGENIDDSYICIFLGEQKKIDGEEITDTCDVDMKAKSIELCKKFSE